MKYKLASCQGSETYEGCLTDAIVRAIEIQREYQPSWGVSISDSDNTTIATVDEDYSDLACELGYQCICWDNVDDCYSGYGASDPYDRSRDDGEGSFVAWDDVELAEIAKQAK